MSYTLRLDDTANSYWDKQPGAPFTPKLEWLTAKIVFAGAQGESPAEASFRLNRDDESGVSSSGPILEITKNSSLAIPDEVFEQFVTWNAHVRNEMADMITRKVIIIKKGVVVQTATNILALTP